MAIPLIGIVDDDRAVREAISSLVRSAGYRSATFASADSFLNSNHIHGVDCLIVDFQMPGPDGLELKRILADSGHTTPIIIISARAAELREKALKQGAVAVFDKPFDDEALLSPDFRF